MVKYVRGIEGGTDSGKTGPASNQERFDEWGSADTAARSGRESAMSRQGALKWGLAMGALVLAGMLVSVAGRASSRPVTAAAPAARVAHPAAGQAPEQSEPGHGSENSGQITPKQRREIIKANFEKMKRDAEELASLAKALQEELDKASENVLSLQIVDKAEKIEKLAKRIKGAARGY